MNLLDIFTNNSDGLLSGMTPLNKHVRHSARGFTLIELIIVTALGTLLVALALPTGLAFYRSVVADDAAGEITVALRTASHDAALGQNDQVHGVKLATSSITIFQGASYATRIASADMVVPLISGVSVSGLPSEIVFAKVSGTPSVTGTLVMTLYGYTHNITIRGNGLILLDE